MFAIICALLTSSICHSGLRWCFRNRTQKQKLTEELQVLTQNEPLFWLKKQQQTRNYFKKKLRTL